MGCYRHYPKVEMFSWGSGNRADAERLSDSILRHGGTVVSITSGNNEYAYVVWATMTRRGFQAVENDPKKRDP